MALAKRAKGDGVTPERRSWDLSVTQAHNRPITAFVLAFKLSYRCSDLGKAWPLETGRRIGLTDRYA